MNAFFSFIASPTGRVVRIVAGLILVVAGFWWMSGIGGRSGCGLERGPRHRLTSSHSRRVACGRV